MSRTGLSASESRCASESYARPRACRSPGRSVAFFLAGFTALIGPVRAQEVDRAFPVVNGPVFAMALDQGTLYIGGDFTRIGHANGSAACVDTSTFRALPGFPAVIGAVRVIRPDGFGGWYLGGEFLSVGGLPRAHIAHVNAAGAVTDWNPGTDGEVWEIVLHGGLVYVIGSFYQVGDQPRYGVAAVRAADGVVTPWRPTPGGDVNALVATDSAVYLGGDFYWWADKPRSNLVALDPVTAELLPWDPAPDGEVEALLLDGQTLYIGGRFGQIVGQARRGLAAIDVTRGTALPWSAGAWGHVYALAQSGRDLYVSGVFLPVGQPFRLEVAAIDAESGAIGAFELMAENVVLDLAVSGGALYAAGYFNAIGGQARRHLAVIDRGTGEIGAWNPNLDDYPVAVAAQGALVCFGGYFNSIDSIERLRLAAIDAASGAIKDWNPVADGRVNALLVRGQTVFAAGSFGRISDQVRARAAAIDAVTGVPTAWNPGVNNTVGEMGWYDSKLVLGGSFTSVGGVARQRLALIDPVTAQVQPWNPGVDGDVRAMVIRDSTVYIGGYFNVAGGQPRRRLAALNARTGGATPWNPGGSDFIAAIAATESTVIVGGTFGSIGGVARPYLAAVDRATGQVTPWNPRTDGYTSGLALNGREVMVAGDFTSMGGRQRSSLAAVDAVTGDATSWDPRASPGPWEILPDGGTTYVAGVFPSMGGLPHEHLAKIKSLGSEIQVSGVTVTEGEGGVALASFGVELTPPAAGTVTVEFATADATAVASSGDYEAAAGTLVFAAGETRKSIAVAVHGDTLREDDETFSVVLSNPSGAQIRLPVATGTITDDDLYRGGKVSLFRARSDAGDPVGLGGRYFIAAPPGTFTSGGGREIARVIASGADYVGDVTFASPRDVPLEPGEYTGGARHPFQSPHQPGLNARIDYGQCAGASTSFEIREIRRDTLDDVNALWATFEQHCDGLTPALRGEVVFNVDIALLVRTPQRWFSKINEPVSFVVSALEAQAAPVRLEAAGLPPGASFTDHGDNTGTFEWPAGSPVLDTLTVTFTGINPSGYRSSSTTEIRIHRPDFVFFDGDSADYVTEGRAYEFHAGNSTFRRWSSGYGAVSVTADRPGDSFHLAFAAPVTRPLTPGRFIADLRPNPAAIGISGNSRGCNFSRGRFDVRQIVYGPSGQVESFWAVFERVCKDRGETWTRGEVRLNADTALYVIPPADAFLTARSDTAITVFAADTRGYSVTLSMVQVPGGATFVDHGDGVGTLHWAAVPALPETMTVHFIATSSAGPMVSASTLLHVADQPTNALVSMVASRATPEGVTLAWYAARIPAGAAIVERRGNSGPWEVAGEAVLEGSGRIVFRDEDVAAGSRYGYRLRLGHGDEAFVSEETWVEIPEWKLSLEPPRPNPVTGPLNAEFTLQRRGWTKLALIDVAGRRLVQLDLGQPEAGRHVVPITAGTTLSPGMYWLVLQHGSESRTRAVVVTR